MADVLVYLNGRRVPAGQAALPIFDAGLVLGTAVSELTRTFRHVPYRLDDHLDRLLRGLDYLGIPAPAGKQELADIAHELIAHNGPLAEPGGDLGIVHFVTPGPYPTYMPAGSEPRPTLCVHTFPLPFERWRTKIRDGARLVTTEVRDVPAASVARTLKQRSRVHYFRADQAARQLDPQASALLLDEHGHVTETATANLLIVQAGRLLSPRGECILPGISRAAVLDLARRIGVPTAEVDLTVADVQRADEAFLTSTPFCMMPVATLDGVSLGTGPIYQRLLAAWSEEVGVDIAGQILGT